MNDAWNLTESEARVLLHVGPHAGQREIRRAFTREAKRAHPDRPGGNAARFRLVVGAYQLLMKLSAARSQPVESASRAHLRRFTAAWAA
jgi:hypothetical protein